MSHNFQTQKISILKQDIESEISKLKSQQSLLKEELKLIELKIEGFEIRLKKLNQ